MGILEKIKARGGYVSHVPMQLCLQLMFCQLELPVHHVHPRVPSLQDIEQEMNRTQKNKVRPYKCMEPVRVYTSLPPCNCVFSRGRPSSRGLK
jgi:hypothetical protein